MRHRPHRTARPRGIAVCISMPGRVLATDGSLALVDLDGRHLRASLLVEPDVHAGDWVLVGAGAVLRRLDPMEADALTRTIETARAADTAPPAAPARPGGTR